MLIICVEIASIKRNAQSGGDTLSLANKYRPTSWDDVVAQPFVVDMLRNICCHELSNRNFLLIGPAGTGKTTMARIIASSLNGEDGNVIELDAASNNGVDIIRDLIQQAKLYPVGQKYKVFIIDECHSLTNSSWQALLKTIEDVPAMSIFIFCTTNPEKIPETILSRVQTFQLSKLSVTEIKDRLEYIISRENSDSSNITYTEDAISYIAKLANGGMRDALTLLDKALTYSNNITSESLSIALGLPDYDDYFALLSAITKHDNAKITSMINHVYNSGKNFVKWFESFHSFVMNIVKYVFMQDIDATMIPSHYADKISLYTTAHASVCLKISNILIKMLRELRTTSYQQEIALTFLCMPPRKKASG
jgi:DNA polymerase-3 subunit gamma/tau